MLEVTHTCSHTMPHRCRVRQACLPLQHLHIHGTVQDKNDYPSASARPPVKPPLSKNAQALQQGFLQNPNDSGRGNTVLPRRAKTKLFGSNTSPISLWYLNQEQTRPLLCHYSHLGSTALSGPYPKHSLSKEVSKNP